MNAPQTSPADDYESLYRDFDSPLMRRVRREAYGEDIGQHSWVTADEMRADITRLKLSPASRLIDLGAGACGPLTFVLASVGCQGTGVELSASALRVGLARAAELGVDRLLKTQRADLNESLPFAPASLDSAISLDVVLHLRDRGPFFAEVARILAPGARFLLTDAGVVTGELSNEDISRRSVHGHSKFVPPGWNESQLDRAGFRLLDTETRTASVERNASGRLRAMRDHRAELEQLSGAEEFERQEEYLETVVALSRRKALSRVMYLTERS